MIMLRQKAVVSISILLMEATHVLNEQNASQRLFNSDATEGRQIGVVLWNL